MHDRFMANFCPSDLGRWLHIKGFQLNTISLVSSSSTSSPLAAASASAASRSATILSACFFAQVWGLKGKSHGLYDFRQTKGFQGQSLNHKSKLFLLFFHTLSLLTFSLPLFILIFGGLRTNALNSKFSSNSHSLWRSKRQLSKSFTVVIQPLSNRV